METNTFDVKVYVRAAAALFALGVLTATPGACRGAPNDASGGSCTLLPSAYSQSCQRDSDCVAVYLGNVCQDVCHGVCPNAAISKSDDARYNSDLSAVPPVPTSNMRTACSCALGPMAVCRAGACRVGSPITDAGPDAGNGCGTSADCPTGDFCDLQARAGGAGVCCPAFGCAPNCPYGVLKDANGCATCQCAPAPDAGGTGTPCTTSLDCPTGGICGYPMAEGCAAKGSCFPAPGVNCKAYAPGCACDGTEISVVCTGLPSGYASKPLLHAGVCTDSGSPDAGACCPVGWSLYSCTYPEGGTGMACHNPALGCASSLTCGQGCDQVVNGRCP
jgi:hypothetical protein